MSFGFAVDVDAWPGLPHDSFRFGLSYPFFITNNDTMQKTFPFLPLEQLFTREKTPFQFSWLQFICNFLAFESFPMFLNTWKWLIKELPMILQVLLAFDMDFH